MAEEVARIVVPCDRLAPVAVRTRLAGLADLEWVLGDAMLVATELVTNAVRHSMCRDEDVLVVCVQQEPDHVRVCVRDPGTSGGTARITHENDWFGGLGLRIVDQLAIHWGSTREAGGYEVWAQLPLVGGQQQDQPARSGFTATAVAKVKSQAAPD